MSDTLSFAELEAQQVELLPARTVLSLISLSKPKPPPGPGANGAGAGGGMGGFAWQGWNLGDPNSCTPSSCHTGGTATGGPGGSTK